MIRCDVLLTEYQVELLHVKSVAMGALSAEIPRRVGERPSVSRFDILTVFIFTFHSFITRFYSTVLPCAGCEVVRIDPLRFLAGWMS